MSETGKTEHTPGPWKFGFESADPEWAIVTNSGGLIVANVNADHRQEANARLIAAAPDLLAALEGIKQDAESFIADCCADIQEGGKGSGHAKWSAVLAAIAKATGGEP